jgi:hypothetical protein
MPSVTFVVPAAPYHDALLERAVASVEAQTVPVALVVIRDTERRGAGWARNQGIAQVRTPFLVFLDADDEVLPQYAERTLAAYQPRRFVYTDWIDADGSRVQASDCPWTANTRNTITSLLLTEDVRRAGGFDESLAGMEDTHLFLKLLSAGICGQHVREPLFRYGKDGQRSKAFYQTPAYYAAVDRFNREFGSRPMSNCGGCGGSPYASPEIERLPMGEQQDGDVLAQALWAGNQSKRGVISGRLYPRLSAPGTLWMDPRDVDAAPHFFRRADAPPDADHTAFVSGVQRVLVTRAAAPMPRVQNVTLPPPPPQTKQRGVQQVLNLYHQH